MYCVILNVKYVCFLYFKYDLEIQIFLLFFDL